MPPPVRWVHPRALKPCWWKRATALRRVRCWRGSTPTLISWLTLRWLKPRSLRLEQRQALLQREVQRYERLLQSGAISAETLDVRKIKLLTVQQELRKAKAELQRRRIKLPDGELVAPFSGTVLEIFARPGERPGSDGVLSIGRSDQMEAVLEVYESDIGRVRVGQRVLLQSENGGFDGELQGRVRRIDPLVQQRDVLSTDPTADTDARVVEVHVSLDPADARRVRQLTGLKLIGRLQP